MSHLLAIVHEVETNWEALGIHHTFELHVAVGIDYQSG